MSIEPTNFEDTYKFSQKSFQNMEGKKGFELYQAYRDALLSLLIDKQDGMKKYARPMFEESDIVGLNLVDKKYIDNFLLCTAIKISAPDAYESLKEIIDRNVQPDKRSQGWSHVYKEMSGAFVYFLELYENVSARQACHISSNFFGVSDSVPREKHLKQKSNGKLVSGKLPDIYTLALLFYCLQAKNVSVETLSAIAPKNQRSEKELNSAIQGYERFKKRIFDHYIAVAEELLNSSEKTILHEPDEELGLSFLTDKDYPEVPSEHEVFAVVCIAVGMELMPNFMQQPEKFINFLSD